MDYIKIVEESDYEVARAIRLEEGRQVRKIEMIASENFTSPAVMAAQGSVLTNKYAEGYPRKRYYGGCEYVDIVEDLARDRARQLFGAEHVNVQPHSGSQANTAAYLAILNHGDKVMGMNLAHGGHLTHGRKANFSGKYFDFVHYGVDRETGYIDYDEALRVAREHRPRLIVAGASAYPRIIDFQKFRAIADEVGALLMVDMAHIAGLVAAGLHPTPFPVAHFVTTTTHKTLRGPRGGMIFCHREYAAAVDKAIFPGMQGGPLMHVIAAKAVALKEAMTPEFKAYQEQVVKNCRTLADGLLRRGFALVSGGTDNHLLLVDLRSKGITGVVAEETLDKVGITVNKNSIPFDPENPMVTSGIRIGTPAATTRGMDEAAMERIAEAIDLALSYPRDNERRQRASRIVEELSAAFPLYGRTF